MFKNTWYLWLSAVMLVFALADHPYSYYQTLRWVVSASAAYSAYKAFEKEHSGWGWIFVVIAVLFNPISPITMMRGSWQLFDIAGAVIFGSYALRKNHS